MRSLKPAQPEVIDVARAKELLHLTTLAPYKVRHRSLSEEKVKDWEHLMRIGKWISAIHGTIILLTKNGVVVDVQDGRHRLAALVRAGIPQTFLVAYTDLDVYEMLDSGQMRTVSQQLRGRGYGPNYANISSGVGLVVPFFEGRLKLHSRQPAVRRSQYFSYIRAHKKTLIENAAIAKSLYHSSFRLLPVSVMLAFLEITNDIHPLNEQFLSDVCLGTVAWSGSPAIVLYQKLRREQVAHMRNGVKEFKSPALLGMLLHGFDKYRENKPIKKFHFRDLPEDVVWAL